jgi:Rieske Fe-S protein
VDRERRRLCQAGLALAAGAAAGCGAPAGNGAPDMSACPLAGVGVGSASAIAVNGAAGFPAGVTNVFVCRDANGYYALDAGCTHLGCDVMLKNASDVRQGFFCMCHGATYDANGLNPTFPAPKPLVHYQLCIEPSGTLIVDPNVTVDPTVRLKP